ncbi:MATE family efflux transporter [Anaerotignum lactatifermentans]|uniref:Multidrug export protein MepA n=1 Tax=Anaerotignum lactatifermentans TaxID=160404 RepID=A0ABS2GC00_9FIRM|nr:MATE family efflux transporter [Anaerotignum lactatifermentans]MBM6830070.1 MATE family efflux transporter [Anaerotignum lactatifermentans]MBM6878313.1 MATE family efflux transporter [Anaerotignum lactatifermentans]MBM6951468.1 MATE family efflux transporter [Anaerotignum lactatifermentans]
MEHQPELQKGLEQENPLGTENIRSLLKKLAFPAITAQVVNVLYNVVDRIYIGHIPETGALALTGVGVCMPIIMLISAFAALVSMGAAPRASVLMGRGEKEEAEKTLGNSFVMLLAIAVILTVFFRLFARDFLMAFGASENTIGYAMEYMNLYCLGTIFVQLALGLNAFITAQGFAKISMLTVMIGAALNIVLDPVFIYLLGMGVQGAALATILSQAVSALWVIRFLLGKNTILKLRAKNFGLRANVVFPSLLLGMSPFIMQATESAISLCFNSSLYRYGGDTAVGAMSILTSIMQFSMLPLMGLAQGAQPITGYNFGAKKPGRVRETFRLLLKCSLAYSLSLWAVCMIFPRLIPMLFTKNEGLLDYTAWALRYYFAGAGIFGIQIACQQTFIAIGNAKTSLFLAVYRKIILLIPLIYLLPAFLEQKDRAVFLAEPAADIIAVCTTAAMFFFQFRRVMAKLEKEENAPKMA